MHSSQLRTGASSQPPRREEYLHKLHERLVSSLPFIDITVDHLFPFLSPWSHNTYQSLVLSEFSIGFVERMRVYEASDLCPFKILMLKPWVLIPQNVVIFGAWAFREVFQVT